MGDGPVEGGVPDSAEGVPDAPGVVKRTNLQDLGLRLVRATAVHRNYIMSTWVISAADAAARRGIRRSLARQREDDCAKLSYNDGLVYVLTDGVDDTVIHGWVAGKHGLLIWGYIPPELRHKGIFRAMVRQVCGREVSYTRRPRGYKVPGWWVYDPYRITEFR